MTVSFRKLKDEDNQLVFEWINNEYLRMMIGTRGNPSISTHKEWFDRKKNDANNVTKIIEYNGIAIGIIGTNVFDLYNGCAEIFLYIGNSLYKQKGIGSMSLTNFCNELFNQHIHKIYARIFSFNKISISCFEKVGFVLEGIQREQVKIPLYDNNYHDLLWYGLLEKDMK